MRAACALLGVELVELPDWSCCGATSAHMLDPQAAVMLPARNLLIANKLGLAELLVPCSACFARLRAADIELRNDPGRLINEPYDDPPTIFHINEFFDRPELLERLTQRVKQSLHELRGVCYYGCLSQRPAAITGSARPEDPLSMERVLEALGMRALPWSYKTDCCGASLSLSRPDLVRQLSGNLFQAAKLCGAELMVVDCPMCQSNLDTRQSQIEDERNTRYGLPIVYISELIALALGDEGNDWWPGHLVDPRPLLHDKGLL